MVGRDMLSNTKKAGMSCPPEFGENKKKDTAVPMQNREGLTWRLCG
jgi:hypothetical protein